MKKHILLLLLAALFLIPIQALAEGDFTLDEKAVLNGMPCSWAQGYEPETSRGVMTIYLPLMSEKSTGRITVALRMKDESVSPFKGTMDGQFQRSDSLYRVALRLELRSDRYSGDYPADLIVTGQDAAGNPLSAVFPLVIRIRDGRMPEEAPHPRVDGVEASFLVGEAGNLIARISNPSRYAAMTRMLLTVTDAMGDILPAGTDKIALPDLLPGESTDVSVPLTVLPTASVALHQLQLSVAWTALGQADMC